MRSLLLFLIICPVFLNAQTSDFIHIDQFGYKRNHTKVAIISNPQTGFNASQSYTVGNILEVRDATTNAIAFSGNPSVWNSDNEHSQSGDKGWWFDFSSLTQEGDYYIYDQTNNETSAKFKISDNVYNDVLVAASKMFYYNRCGIAKTAPYVLNGFSDAMSFSQDTQALDVHQQNNTSTTKDMSGGWFDAGDYNKYVTFAEAPVHDLLWAYTENPTIFGDNWNIPESGNNIPDIVDEIKWELDWLLKMINPDGSVHIKIGGRNHDENSSSPPSINTETRYYEQTCTSSALAATTMLAHAAKVLSTISSLNSYAQTLQNEAIKTWAWVLPYIKNNTLQENCDDLSVVSGDADKTEAEQKVMALVAAIYLFDSTNDNQYQQYIISHLSDISLDDQWSNYMITTIDALLYYTSLSNADTTVKNSILSSANGAASNNWNNYFEFNDLDLYRAYANDWTYHWGSNIQKSNFGNLNFIFANYQINTSANSTYVLRAKEHLHYFHGVNPLGLVYLSNMNSFGAEKSVNQIYHSWFADGNNLWDDVQTSTYGPAPGYVPGGANSFYDANTSLSPPYNQPQQKSYLGFNSIAGNSWEITEPSITNQAAYVRLLARVIGLNNDGSLATDTFELDIKTYTMASNPFENDFTILSNITENITISIFNTNGQLIMKPKVVSTNQIINCKSLASGMHFLKIENNYGNTSLKIIKK